MSLFFYDVCLSSKTVSHAHHAHGIRGGERIADFVRKNLFFFSPAAFSLHFLSALSSLDNCRRRREKKRKKDNRVLCPVLSCPDGVVFLVIFSCYRRLYPTTLPAP